MEGEIKLDKLIDKEIRILIVIMIIIYIFFTLNILPSAIARSYINVIYIYILAFTWSFMYALGYFPLSIAAFYGLGGYLAYYLLMIQNRFNIPSIISITLTVLGVIATSLWISFIIAYSTIRLRGPYFIILTFALGELFRNFFNNIEIVVFGRTGRIFPIRLSELEVVSYLTLLAILSMILWSYIKNSKMGIAIQMIGRDETLAEAMGVNTFRVKMITFMTASTIQTLVGLIMAGYLMYIEPQHVFNPYIAFIAPISALVGGSSSTLGPFIGSIIMIYISEQISFILIRGHLIILGVILVILSVFVKKGVYDYIHIFFTARKVSTSTRA